MPGPAGEFERFPSYPNCSKSERKVKERMEGDERGEEEGRGRGRESIRVICIHQFSHIVSNEQLSELSSS